jgi:hypothetical protein
MTIVTIAVKEEDNVIAMTERKKQSHLDGQKGITSVVTLLRNDGRHSGQ